jgi:hypothetical protein
MLRHLQSKMSAQYSIYNDSCRPCLISVNIAASRRATRPAHLAPLVSTKGIHSALHWG